MSRVLGLPRKPFIPKNPMMPRYSKVPGFDRPVSRLVLGTSLERASTRAMPTTSSTPICGGAAIVSTRHWFISTWKRRWVDGSRRGVAASK